MIDAFSQEEAVSTSHSHVPSTPVLRIDDLLSTPARHPTRIAEILPSPLVRDARAGASACGTLRLSLADFASPESPSTGRHPLPDHARLVATLAAAGISPGTTMVLAPTTPGAFSIAARGWVTLRWAGVSNVIVLADSPSSGFEAQLEALIAWAASSGVDVNPTPFEQNNTVVTDAAGVSRRKKDVVLVDARLPDAYGGAHDHIEGSVNLPTATLLEAGALTDTDELHRVYRETLGLAPGAQPLIVSCGSGISASVQALALAQAGITAPVYIGSWSEWSKRRTALAL